MLTTLLLKTLLELEQGIGRIEPLEIRRALMEAQLQLMRIHEEEIGLLEEIRRLRGAAEDQDRGCSCTACTPAEGEAADRWAPVVA